MSVSGHHDRRLAIAHRHHFLHRLGIFGQTLHALVPRVAQIIMNTTFRMFPDSEAAKKKSAAEQSGEQPSADQVAFQQVMRGIYF